MKISNISDQEMPSLKRKIVKFIDQSKRSYNRKLFRKLKADYSDTKCY